MTAVRVNHQTIRIQYATHQKPYLSLKDIANGLVRAGIVLSIQAWNKQNAIKVVRLAERLQPSHTKTHLGILQLRALCLSPKQGQHLCCCEGLECL